jgi:predicted  nucleic acid-binding Zn-ribbon protein
MNNYIDQINNLQKKVDESKLEQARLQERKKGLEDEKIKLVTELKVYEIEESKFDEEIKKLEESIQQELVKCQELMK